MKFVKRVLKEIDWILDFYLLDLVYTKSKQHRYFDYMYDKWGDRFSNRYDDILK